MWYLSVLCHKLNNKTYIIWNQCHKKWTDLLAGHCNWLIFVIGGQKFTFKKAPKSDKNQKRSAYFYEKPAFSHLGGRVETDKGMKKWVRGGGQSGLQVNIFCSHKEGVHLVKKKVGRGEAESNVSEESTESCRIHGFAQLLLFHPCPPFFPFSPLPLILYFLLLFINDSLNKNNFLLCSDLIYFP